MHLVSETKTIYTMLAFTGLFFVALLWLLRAFSAPTTFYLAVDHPTWKLTKVALPIPVPRT